MSDDRTVPLESGGVPIGTLRVEVVEGSDVGREVRADSETLDVGTAEASGFVLCDPTISRYHVELTRRSGGILVRDLDSTNGTRAGDVRIMSAVVPVGTVLSLGETKIKVSDGDDAEVELFGGHALAELRGATPGMRRLMAQVQRLASGAVSVLLLGESGTGKELVARALHDLSARGSGAFVTVDCGALVPTLVASELFGHERGAFTGADRAHVGAFERADGGTLLLDEVGELPAALQSSLLGVLERRRIRRLGGQHDIDIDVRVVAATHRDLRADINAGRFRLDLYYRLAPVSLALPALRERLDDVPMLVEHFLRQCGFDEELGDLISGAAMKTLQEHRWPGNVRELRNWVEATVAMGEPQHLPSGPLGSGTGADPIGDLLDFTWKEARGNLLREFESRYLARLLERADRNVSKAARLARMDRSHLTDLLRRHGLR